MRFLEINEIWDWCGSRGVQILDSGAPAPDGRLAEKSRWVYAAGARSGQEPNIAKAVIAQLGEWNEALLWVTLTGVWASSEDWPAYYAIRGNLSERRSIEVTPGHLFEPRDGALLEEFLTAAMENGWDAFVLPAIDGRAGSTRVRVSHDEWIELQSTRPISIPSIAV